MHPRLATLALALPAALALVVGVRPAHAATTPPGVNLRWDNCYDDGGATNKAFACDTNAGSERLVLSFVLSEPLANVSGVEIAIEVAATSAALPAWWLLVDPSYCRPQGISITAALPPTAVACSDWASGMASMNIAGYDVGYIGTPSAARLRSANAVQVTGVASLSPGVEYLAASFLINHTKTVGAGACAGCDVPVCLIVGRLDIFTSSSGAAAITLLGGANGPSSQVATWQGGVASNSRNGCGATQRCLHRRLLIPGGRRRQCPAVFDTGLSMFA